MLVLESAMADIVPAVPLKYFRSMREYGIQWLIPVELVRILARIQDSFTILVVTEIGEQEINPIMSKNEWRLNV